MSTTLHFKIKDNIDTNKYNLIELFFKSWVDQTCDSQVKYYCVGQKSGYKFPKEIFRADFERQEDALAITLSGVPIELRNYLEIVDTKCNRC